MTDHEQYRDLAADYSALSESATATGAPDVALYWATRATIARTQADNASRPTPRPACMYGIRPASACGSCREQFGGAR